jgi:small-conductance mechanosensitive channel
VQGIVDTLGQLVLTLAGRLLTVALIVAVFVLVYVVVVAVVRRLAARAATTPLPGDGDVAPEDRAIREATRARRLDTLVLFTSRLGRVVLVILSGLAAAGVLVPELIAALGSLGVALGVAVGGAIGFGAQQLVRDYLNGILILGENPFSVGDVIAIAGVQGTVEEVGLRRTVVRDVDGTVHSVPNGEILVASNFTRTYARVRERFVLAAGTDIAQATRVLDDACAAFASADDWTDRFVEPPRVLRVDAAAAGEHGIAILVTATVRPGEQWEIAGELRRRAIEALGAARIDLAAGRTFIVARDPRPDAGDAGAAVDAEGSADYT